MPDTETTTEQTAGDAAGSAFEGDEPTQTGGEETTPAAGAEAPDISEQIAALHQRLDAANVPSADAAAGPEPEAVSVDDLFEALTAEDDLEDDEPDQGDPEAGAETPPDEAAEQLAAFDEAVRERVADQLAPHLARIEARERQRDLVALNEKYKGELASREMLDAIRDRLAPYAERYGNEGLLTDPGLVEQAFLAERALRAAANETPAEVAAGQGASIETGTGAGAADSGETLEEQIVREMLAAAPGGSQFD